MKKILLIIVVVGLLICICVGCSNRIESSSDISDGNLIVTPMTSNDSIVFNVQTFGYSEPVYSYVEVDGKRYDQGIDPNEFMSKPKDVKIVLTTAIGTVLDSKTLEKFMIMDEPNHSELNSFKDVCSLLVLGGFEFPDLQKLNKLRWLACGSDDISKLQEVKSLDTLILFGNLNNKYDLETIPRVRELSIQWCDNITDLDALENANSIETLIVFRSGLEKIQAVNNMKSLKNLSIGACNINDLDALKGATQIKKLRLCYMKDINDIDALSNLKSLINLTLDELNITSINTLKSLTNLEILVLNELPIESIDALENLVRIKGLSLSDVKIDEIDSIKNMKSLKNLYLKGLPDVNDIDVLRKIGTIENLHLDYININDITVLKELPSLKNLFLSSLNGINNFDVINDLESKGVNINSEDI